MIRRFVAFFSCKPADLDAAEREVNVRREQALKAAAKRREKDPDFHVRRETILDASADDETRALMRRLAGAD